VSGVLFFIGVNILLFFAYLFMVWIMKRAVAYIRVSTRSQDENNQRLAIEKYCREHGIEVLKYFVDKGISRSVSWKKRPGAREMVEFLERGGKDIVDYVVVFDFTRLGYNLRDIFSLFDKIEKDLGLRIISVKDSWLQLENESIRDLLIRIFSWVAEVELELRRERQQAAWEAGKQKGRPPKVPDKILVEYYKKYRKYGTKKYVWLRLREDGYDISYDRFLKRLKKLVKTKEIINV